MAHTIPDPWNQTALQMRGARAVRSPRLDTCSGPLHVPRPLETFPRFCANMPGFDGVLDSGGTWSRDTRGIQGSDAPNDRVAVRARRKYSPTAWHSTAQHWHSVGTMALMIAAAATAAATAAAAAAAAAAASHCGTVAGIDCWVPPWTNRPAKKSRGQVAAPRQHPWSLRCGGRASQWLVVVSASLCALRWPSRRRRMSGTVTGLPRPTAPVPRPPSPHRRMNRSGARMSALPGKVGYRDDDILLSSPPAFPFPHSSTSDPT